MKKILLASIALVFTLSVFGQKNAKIQKVSKQVKVMSRTIKANPEISGKFKAIAGPILAADDDDCTPPPCTGIIDPWTCECHSDIIDPWEDDKIASKMKAFQRFEQGLKMGEGKSIIMIGEYKAAHKRYPGNSLKAMVNRLNYYAQAAK